MKKNRSNTQLSKPSLECARFPRFRNEDDDDDGWMALNRRGLMGTGGWLKWKKNTTSTLIISLTLCAAASSSRRHRFQLRHFSLLSLHFFGFTFIKRKQNMKITKTTEVGKVTNKNPFGHKQKQTRLDVKNK